MPFSKWNPSAHSSSGQIHWPVVKSRTMPSAHSVVSLVSSSATHMPVPSSWKPGAHSTPVSSQSGSHSPVSGFSLVPTGQDSLLPVMVTEPLSSTFTSLPTPPVIVSAPVVLKSVALPFPVITISSTPSPVFVPSSYQSSKPVPPVVVSVPLVVVSAPTVSRSPLELLNSEASAFMVSETVRSGKSSLLPPSPVSVNPLPASEAVSDVKLAS